MGFEVDRPFEEIDTSSQTDIFPANTPLAIIKELGGVRSICTVTDLRQLTSTHTNCLYDQSTVNQVSACGQFMVSSDSTNRPDQVNREVAFVVEGSQLMDEREVEIGDRIRFLTGAASTQDAQSGKWNTRTVDSVTYGSIQIDSTNYHNNNQINSFVVSEPWEANSNWVLAFNDGAGTTEAKSCSGRGICDDSSGECQCFKGYAVSIARSKTPLRCNSKAPKYPRNKVSMRNTWLTFGKILLVFDCRSLDGRYDTYGI